MKILLSAFLFITFSASSQIVNIENKRLNGKEDAFFGSIDLNINFTMNTKQFLQIGDKLKIGYMKRKSQVMLITDHAFVKSNDNSFVNKGYEHVRFNHTLKDSGRIVYEAFHQGQFNKIQKINLRLLFGTGFRFKMIDQKKYQLSFGTGFMSEYEELLDNGVSRDILSTNYISFDGQFSESVGMNSISYFQPKMIDFGQYRFANETQLRFKINKYLSFKVVYSLTHDSRDIEDVRKTNYVLKNTISLKF